ncbi:helix-turn-helix domain-containing protein [Zooshikella sp. RANM57]|uniref:helix-turn-helix domain-containing protein n=1 Tax=Zooshikella sp. RANM57 TaxID=3425863 RepID=UPI003D6E9A93
MRSKEVDIDRGRRLYSQMKKLGLTERALSKKTGIPASTIANYKKGVGISLDRLIALSYALEVSTDYILLGDNDIEVINNLKKAIKLLPDDLKAIELKSLEYQVCRIKNVAELINAGK